MILLGERFGLWAWIGTALSFAGIGLIALGEGSELKVDAGALYILGAAVCTTITAVVQKPLLARHKPLTVAAGNMVIGALLLSPALPETIAQAQVASIEGLGAALYLGIVPSLIAYATWSIVLSRMPASRASNFMYCVPPVSTLMGFLWLGEVPTMVGILGGIMALAGVAIVNLRNR
jgi:drug/metabolite transporter (DMT)-like permease